MTDSLTVGSYVTGFSNVENFSVKYFSLIKKKDTQRII